MVPKLVQRKCKWAAVTWTELSILRVKCFDIEVAYSEYKQIFVKTGRSDTLLYFLEKGMYLSRWRYVKGMFLVANWVCIGYVFLWKSYVLNTCHPVYSDEALCVIKYKFDNNPLCIKIDFINIIEKRKHVLESLDHT